MNRRGFLKLLLPAAGAVAIAPELIAEIWAPRRTYFLPPRGGWHDVRLLTGEIGRYENIRIIDTGRGFMYSNQLADILRQSVKPLVRFRQGLALPESTSWNVHSDTVWSRHALGTERR